MMSAGHGQSQYLLPCNKCCDWSAQLTSHTTQAKNVHWNEKPCKVLRTMLCIYFPSLQSWEWWFDCSVLILHTYRSSMAERLCICLTTQLGFIFPLVQHSKIFQGWIYWKKLSKVQANGNIRWFQFGSVAWGRDKSGGSESTLRASFEGGARVGSCPP